MQLIARFGYYQLSERSIGYQIGPKSKRIGYSDQSIFCLSEQEQTNELHAKAIGQHTIGVRRRDTGIILPSASKHPRRGVARPPAPAVTNQRNQPQPTNTDQVAEHHRPVAPALSRAPSESMQARLERVLSYPQCVSVRCEQFGKLFGCRAGGS